ncbi:hypothetical protein B2J93_2961 [Marssonina coronariae]|uniref:Uncharacterized protein n=1 Tax=Diplocarpon coronariae TaxID=2795749 RepID=A0A218Z592_9HELO|nr:hypothetical protein B2J93_2961 [Marssonina coronariae]
MCRPPRRRLPLPPTPVCTPVRPRSQHAPPADPFLRARQTEGDGRRRDIDARGEERRGGPWRAQDRKPDPDLQAGRADGTTDDRLLLHEAESDAPPPCREMDGGASSPEAPPEAAAWDAGQQLRGFPVVRHHARRHEAGAGLGRWERVVEREPGGGERGVCGNGGEAGATRWPAAPGRAGFCAVLSADAWKRSPVLRHRPGRALLHGARSELSEGSVYSGNMNRGYISFLMRLVAKIFGST